MSTIFRNHLHESSLLVMMAMSKPNGIHIDFNSQIELTMTLNWCVRPVKQQTI